MFRNMRIGTRLLLGFAAVLALMVGMAIVSWSRLNQLHAEIGYFDTNTVPSLYTAAELRTEIALVRRLENQHVLFDDAAELDGVEQRLGKAWTNIRNHLDHYSTLTSDADDRRLYEDAKSKVSTYSAVWDRLKSVSRRKLEDPTQAAAAKALLFGESRTAFNAAYDAVGKVWGYNQEAAHRAAQVADANYQRAVVVLGVLLVAAGVVGIGIAVALMRSVTRPVQHAMAAAERVAEGDLSREIVTDRGDEMGSLLHTLARMQGKLHEAVGTIRAATESVSTASVEIAQGNLDLSSRTEEQASSLEQTAASMEQMAATVQSNSESTAQASGLAVSASAQADRGAEAIGRVESVMTEISESSRRISEIIGVIDGIAFQTNILALNAAVEAARAGEQGRGFAVVASEVRTLAQRSAGAAKDIKNLIAASTGKVGEGSRLVHEAVAAMHQIRESVRHVSGILDEAKAAAAEQNAGIQQVNVAVSQLDQMTQQNAALVEQSTAAADSLKDQAQRLAQAVAMFNLGAVTVTPQVAMRAGPAARASGTSVSVRPPPRVAPKIKVAAPRVAATPTRPPAALIAPAKAPPPRLSDTSNTTDWEEF